VISSIIVETDGILLNIKPFHTNSGGYSGATWPLILVERDRFQAISGIVGHDAEMVS